MPEAVLFVPVWICDNPLASVEFVSVAMFFVRCGCQTGRMSPLGTNVRGAVVSSALTKTEIASVNKRRMVANTLCRSPKSVRLDRALLRSFVALVGR